MTQQAIRSKQLSQAIELNKAKFDETIASHDVVFVDFWAPWCGPCKSFAPIYEVAASKHADMVFAKVNVDDEKELAAKYQIRSIPTLMAFRKQAVVFSQPSMLPAARLDEVIRQVKEG